MLSQVDLSEERGEKEREDRRERRGRQRENRKRGLQRICKLQNHRILMASVPDTHFSGIEELMSLYGTALPVRAIEQSLQNQKRIQCVKKQICFYGTQTMQPRGNVRLELMVRWCNGVIVWC